MSWLLSPAANTIDLGDLQDVTITSIAAGEIIKWNGTVFVNNTLAEAGISAVGHTHVEADITDLQAYLTAEVNDLTAAVIWANIPIANVPTGTTSSTVSLGNHTHDGITDTNLVDKSANEAITGHWAVPSTINTQNGNYTLVLGDAGKTIHKASGGAGETITIPANASVAYDTGTLIGFNNDGGGDLTIAITTDTLTGTDAATGSRTLGTGHVAVIQKLTATTWKYAASDL